MYHSLRRGERELGLPDATALALRQSLAAFVKANVGRCVCYCNVCMRFVVSEEASPNAEENEVLRCESVAKRGDDGDHGVIDVVL